MDLNEIMRQFRTEVNASAYGNGHINDTYYVKNSEYILQKINTKIFLNPDELMDNIVNVTEFLREKIKAAGGNPDRETLTVIKTVDGKNFYRDSDGSCYRAYVFIKDTVTIENDKTVEDMYNAGKGFGKFMGMLSDFPVGKLYETIVDFHNTPKRVEALKKAIAEDKAGRAASVAPEIEFALKNAEFAHVVVDGLADGSIPLRVTHNDTKINNILFDDKTKEAIAVIDLDTVMPGSMLYDFGDALRIGASTGAEDETDLSKVNFDLEIFKRFTEGYLETGGDTLVEREIELLAFSAKLLTYECGIRFLTDYLNGDTYFKIHHEHHNLDRARNQFKLVEDMTAKESQMKEIVNNAR